MRWVGRVGNSDMTGGVQCLKCPCLLYLGGLLELGLPTVVAFDAREVLQWGRQSD